MSTRTHTVDHENVVTSSHNNNISKILISTKSVYKPHGTNISSIRDEIDAPNFL